MADIGSVATSLAMAVAGIVYPNGAGIGAVSVTGNRAVVKRGWPGNADLTGNCGIKTGGVDLVTVMPLRGMYRQLNEPLGWPWEFVSSQAATVSATVAGATVTIALNAGLAPAGVVGLTLRAEAGSAMQDNVGISYAVQPQDTAQTIASALAGQIPGASASSGQASFPQARSITASVSGLTTARRIVRRQSQEFLVSIWSSDWQRRDALSSAIDQGMAAVNWLDNADGTEAQILGAGSEDNDEAQNSGIYRRDLRYRVIFDSIQKQTTTNMMFGIGMLQVLTGAGVALQPFGQVAPAAGAITDPDGDVMIDANGNLVEQVQGPVDPNLSLNSAGYVVSAGS